MSKKRTFWPYGILLSLLAIILSCVATIIFSLDYPVYEDDSFLQKYQSVDRNINEIAKQHTAFEKDYRIEFNLNPNFDKKNRPFYELENGENSLEFFIKALQNDENVNNINFQALLTRPHTSEQDKELSVVNKAESFFIALPELEKGRWQVKLRAEKDSERVGFYTYNLFIK